MRRLKIQWTIAFFSVLIFFGHFSSGMAGHGSTIQKKVMAKVKALKQFAKRCSDHPCASCTATVMGTAGSAAAWFGSKALIAASNVERNEAVCYDSAYKEGPGIAVMLGMIGVAAASVVYYALCKNVPRRPIRTRIKNI